MHDIYRQYAHAIVLKRNIIFISTNKSSPLLKFDYLKLSSNLSINQYKVPMINAKGSHAITGLMALLSKNRKGIVKPS